MSSIAGIYKEAEKNKNSIAHHILQTAPYFPRCSNDKTATMVRPLKYAVNYSYMQINRSDMVSWLVFDLDHPNPLIWEDNGLPAPNLMVRDRNKNTSHLYYAIVPVCISDKASRKPISYMKAIYSAMAKKLAADFSFNGVITKTPFHHKWATSEIHSDVYELGELASYVELEIVSIWKKKELFDVSHSRNCTLFEELRLFAYSIVNYERKHSTYDNFKMRVEEYANQCNNFILRGFSSNLSYSEIKATVKSVSRWTWDKYTGKNSINRGKLELDKSLSLKERQTIAAKTTHIERIETTLKKIKEAISLLQKKQLPINFSNLAKVTYLTRQTISKYKNDIAAFLSSKRKLSLKELFSVKYGVSDNSSFLNDRVVDDALFVELLLVDYLDSFHNYDNSS